MVSILKSGDIEINGYEMQDRIESLNKTTADLRQEVAKLKEANEQLGLSNNTLENAEANASGDVERARKELAAVKKENQQAMEQLQSTWDELTEASSKRVALQTEVDELDERLANCEAEPVKLNLLDLSRVCLCFVWG